MRSQSDYPPAVAVCLFILAFATVGLLTGCSSPGEDAQKVVKAAWEARVAGDHDRFATLVVPADSEWVKPSGAVVDTSKLDDTQRKELAQSLTVATAVYKESDDVVDVKARVTWAPPGQPSQTESLSYIVRKTDDGWKLDLGLEKRAAAAQSLREAKTAMRAGRSADALRLIDDVKLDELSLSERNMVAQSVEAVRAQVKDADTIAELRTLMNDHHNTEDPALRANIVKKARELGIDELDLPDDIATLWAEASSGAKAAEAVADLGENLRFEGEASKVGHGARVTIAITNANDVAVANMSFSIDLIDSDGIRLHRINHEWKGPLAPGKSAETMVAAPSVPPGWEGAINLRLDSVSSAP